MSFMTEDRLFESSAGPEAAGTSYVGREAVRAGHTEIWTTFPVVDWGNARHFCWATGGFGMDFHRHPSRWDPSRGERLRSVTFRDGKIALNNPIGKIVLRCAECGRITSREMGAKEVRSSARFRRADRCSSVVIRQNPERHVLARAFGWVVAGRSGGDLVLPRDGAANVIRVVEGDGQTGAARQPLTGPVVIEATNTAGDPVEGATVEFGLTSAGERAEAAPATATTSAQGRAEAHVVLATRWDFSPDKPALRQGSASCRRPSRPWPSPTTQKTGAPTSSGSVTRSTAS